jgi:hypothetical protein
MPTNHNPGYVPIDEVQGQGKPYRLWRRPPLIAGNPVIILVHGAVVPAIGKLHDPNYINNDKYCFYQLEFFLYNDFNYNVFTFEYADMAIYDPLGNLFGYVNYGSLQAYGDRLIEAIGIAQQRIQSLGGTVGPASVIAHSVGGLIARYAVNIWGLDRSISLSHWIRDITDLTLLRSQTT